MLDRRTRSLDLARLGLQVEAHYGEPQDIEWAIGGGETYLVQSRPITTLGAAPAPIAGAAPAAGRLLLRGLAASDRRRQRPVRVLRRPEDGQPARSPARCSSRR